MSGASDKEAHAVVPTAREERHVERHFDIRKGIMLGFFNGREQYDVLIDPGQGTLMFNGRDIYWLIDGEQRMSDTINNAVGIWLGEKSSADNNRRYGRFASLRAALNTLT